MKILISPAKSLDLETPIPQFASATTAHFLQESVVLQEILANQSVEELQHLMKLSPNLAQLNYKRNQAFSDKDNSKRPCLYTFNGEVYTGIDVFTLDQNALDFLQENLFILSGLYGVLRPLDEIQPYRLEMGTKLQNPKGNTLYNYWKTLLTQFVEDTLSKDEPVINLASKEYSSSINLKKISKTTRVIEPVFKDFKNGKLKTISFYAKKARGQMVRYLTTQSSQDNQIDHLLEAYTVDGYFYNHSQTVSKDQPVFIREH